MKSSTPSLSTSTIKTIGGNTPDVLSSCYSKTFSDKAILAYMNRLFPDNTFVEILNPSSNGPYGGEGVVFGDGVTPPTIDDLSISGNRVTGLTASNTSISVSDKYEEDYWERTCIYSITNTTASAMTIKEAAIAFTFYGEKNRYYADYVNCPYIVDRTVLDTPVTIEPGGIGQMTYTIRMNYPVA